MKNVLATDRTIEEVCREVLSGSYPQVAKQLAEQLILALKEIEALKAKLRLDKSR